VQSIVRIGGRAWPRAAVLVVAIVVAFAAAPQARADPGPGFTAALGGGLNVGKPFAEAQLGRRFARARYFELFVDYSFDKAISQFSFQTLGLGARTYFARFDRFELYHQAVAAFALASGGNSPVARDLGDRLLGGLFTQGVGIAARVHGCWTAAFTVSTGYPVWLRTELAVRYTF
jgi:hypothetical protein